VLRATRRIEDIQPMRAPRHWLLGATVGRVLLVGLALLSGSLLWSKSKHTLPRDNRADAQHAQRNVPAPIIPEVETVALAPRVESPPSVTSLPTANELLAAARKARTRNDPSRARRLYERVILGYSSTPAAAAARVALGRLIYEDLGDSRAALTHFDAYLRQHPGGPLAEDALYYRALSLDRLGRTQQARESLRSILESYPNSLYAAPARRRLATELRE
jgi:TolA-binding protein